MDLVYRGYKEPRSKNVLWIRGDEMLLYYNGKWEIVNVPTTIDDTLSPTSTHAIQNKAVYDTFESKVSYMPVIHTDYNIEIFIDDVNDLIQDNIDQEDSGYIRLKNLINLILQNAYRYQTVQVEFVKEGYATILVNTQIDPEEYCLVMAMNRTLPFKQGFINEITLAYRYDDDYTYAYPVRSFISVTEIENVVTMAAKKAMDNWFHVTALNTLTGVTREQLLNGMFDHNISHEDIRDLSEGKYLGIVYSRNGYSITMPYCGGSSYYHDGRTDYSASFASTEIQGSTFKYVDQFSFEYTEDGNCSSKFMQL